MSRRTDREFQGTEQFSILRQLGHGSFGVVYEAFDHKRNGIVALKTLNRVDAASLSRFKREFRALSDIVHPNLVMLYELLSDREQWFFTMELVHGVHLLPYVREETVPPPPPYLPAGEDPSGVKNFDFSDVPTLRDNEDLASAAPEPLTQQPPAVDYDRVRDAFVQLSEAIGALHHSGLLHRDIKPSNVMVTSEGRVVLLDFGLVAELGPEDVWASVNIVGTPAYMSPEQAGGQNVTQASDWYSVGTMLYQVLTGRLPFAGTVLEMLSAKKQMEPLPPAAILSNVPSDLNNLCCDLLRRDPQMRPGLHDIVARLGRSPTQGRRRTDSEARGRLRLVGRERHLKNLEDAYQKARSGQSVIVLVQGRSGMGKTALVNSFLHDIHNRDKDAVILTGRCYERESVPYKAVDSLIESLAGHLKKLAEPDAARLLPRHMSALARLFPVLLGVPAMQTRQRLADIADSQELRRRAFAALRELFSRMADEGPVLLYIDDLQWGDVDSGALLEELVRPPEAPAMLLLASYRSEESATSPLLQRLTTFRNRAGAGIDVRDLSVGELPFDEARALALALIGHHDPGSLQRATTIARESMGSPFFVEELGRYHQQQSVGSATTLDELIRQRVSQLPSQARHLLEVVAVAGQPVDRQVASQSASFETDDHAAVGGLRAAHLVRLLSSGQMETYHDRIRETVVASLTADALRQLHHRLAMAWEAVGADPETLAVHFDAAGRKNDAAHYAAGAAERAAAALAFDRAARFYRMALDLGGEETQSIRALRTALGDALANAGRGAEAAQAYQHAAKNADAALAIDLQRRAAEQLLFAGHIDEGRAAARAVLARLGMRMPVTPRKALMSLLYHRALFRLRGFRFRERSAEQVSADAMLRIDTCRSLSLVLGLYDVIAGTDFHSRHLLLALRAGEPYRVARALAPELAYRALSGSSDRRRNAKLEAVLDDLVRRAKNTYVTGVAQLYKGMAAFLEGRFVEGGELLEYAESILREKCTGTICELDTCVLFWMFCLIHLGEWVKLNQRLPALLKDAEERGDLYAAVGFRGRIQYLLYLVADDIEAARQLERDLQNHLPSGGFESPHYWAWLLRVETTLYAGNVDEAWTELEKGWLRLTGSLLTRVGPVRIESHHLRARCALAVGRFEEAEREVRMLEREKSQWANALAGTIRVGLALAYSDQRNALELAVAAEQDLAFLHIRHYPAALQRRRGELLGGEEGGALINSADALLSKQGIRNTQRMTAFLVPGLRSGARN